MESKNIEKFTTLCISLKPLLKVFDFNNILLNKRKTENNQITFSIPNEIYLFIESQDDLTRYIKNLIKKYKIFLKNIDNEIFFSFPEYVRFFIYLDYFEFMNDVKIEINSRDFITLKKNQIKNGVMTEIQDGKEYLREYENGTIIKENEIKKRLI